MPRKQKSQFGRVAVILTWVTLGLAGYYAFHRPFTPEFVRQTAASLRDIFITAMLFALAGALGSRLLARLQAPPLARLAARAALGLGILSLFYLLVGSSLGTNGLVAWLTLLFLGFWLRNEFATWAADFSGFKTLWKLSGGLGRVIAWLCIMIFAIALLKSLAPPTGFDALVYHLSLPKIYLGQGHIGYIAENTFSGYPQLPHMLITWAGALGMQHGALVGWGIGLLAAIGSFGHLATRLNTKSAWVAVAALLCGASLSNALTSAYVDWASILMAWGMLFSINLWAEKRKPEFVMWAGIFAGLAFGTKYSAGLLAPLGLIAVLWIGGRDWRAAWRFALAALVVSAPWLLRNALATGNPFYPVLLTGGEMDAFRLNYYQGFAPQGSWLDVLLLPMRATFAGVEGGRVGDAPGYESSIGPLLLILGTLALLPSGEKKGARHLKDLAALVAIGGLVTWAIAGRLSGHLIRTQLYYILFPAFATLAAYGFAAAEHIRLPSLRLGRVLGALVVVTLGFNALQFSLGALDSGVLQVWSGQASEETYLEKNLGLYALVMHSLPAELPPDRRVLMLWEPRAYACAPDCDPDEIIDRWPHDLAKYGSPDSVLAAWRGAGYTHVLYYRLGAQFIHADPEHFHLFDLDLLEDTLASLTMVRDYNGDYLVYSLAP